VTGLNAKIIL
jgi:hypothetical protein